jgi:hypothetical protein
MRRIISMLPMIALVLPLAAPLAANAQTTPPATQPPAPAYQQKFIAKFEAANTTHDGHLTLAQAQAAGMKHIVKHFAQIDTGNKGYVTLDEIQAWHQAHQHQSSTPPASS